MVGGGVRDGAELFEAAILGNDLHTKFTTARYNT